MSASEAFQYISLCYDEMRVPAGTVGTIRDRAFSSLWTMIQDGKMRNWSGDVRNFADNNENRVATNKNYRNFIRHLGWAEATGALTSEGLTALHVGTMYGAVSQPFIDLIAQTILLTGKHLVLFNAISEFQDSAPSITTEKQWLAEVETFLEGKGLLKRNPERAAVAIAKAKRGFLKAEKQLWRVLGLIVPNGARVYHPNRGFIFNWSRITDLVRQ